VSEPTRQEVFARLNALEAEIDRLKTQAAEMRHDAPDASPPPPSQPADPSGPDQPVLSDASKTGTDMTSLRASGSEIDNFAATHGDITCS
jgi:hypothetical protein